MQKGKHDGGKGIHKMECDYPNGWFKKWSHTQKISPKMANPRDIDKWKAEEEDGEGAAEDSGSNDGDDEELR